MKSRKHFVPEADFAFASETFSLTGEVAIEIKPAARPFQAVQTGLFVDRAELEAGREILRTEEMQCS